jgi:hypothetical protein
MTNPSLAVLIDADNASSSIIEGLLAEIAQLGTASVKRIYGDWTSPNLAHWKAVLLAHSIQPIQQFSYTTGKNATDSAMIIDAMDLLYAGQFAGFCIVSSDSDFTKLAVRIRESGRSVYGFGEKKTPKPFVAACDRFIYTEIFSSNTSSLSTASISKPKIEATQAPKKYSKSELRRDAALLRTLRSGVDACSEDDGWAKLAQVGSFITKQLNDFDPRHYGYAKLSELVVAIEVFDAEKRGTHLYLRHIQKPVKAITV